MTDSIEIRDESVTGIKKLVLYIRGNQKATLIKKGVVTQLNWQVYGPQFWPEAKVLLQGLLELSILADQLASGEKSENEAD